MKRPTKPSIRWPFSEGDFMNKRLKDIAEIRLCLVQRSTSDKMYKVLTPMKLLENNVVDGFALDNKVRADDATKVCVGDIIIKRICPWFVNYIDKIEDDVYASGNLIIITARTVDPKYLAFILNTEIPKITQSLSGAKIPAVGRGDLEEILIPILPIEKQQAIGLFWQKSVELYKLKRKLDELELIQAKGILRNAINGGK